MTDILDILNDPTYKKKNNNSKIKKDLKDVCSFYLDNNINNEEM